MKNFILGIVTILLIGGVGFGAYFFGKSSSKRLTPSPSPIVTQESETPALTTKSDDNELIKKALFDKNGWTDTNGITVTVSTNDGAYASGTVTAQGGGGYFFAAKVGGTWQIVADGNGVILCKSLTAYPNFPKTLIPECYDDVAGKNVTR